MSKKYSLVLTDSFEKLERTENILTLKPQIPNFGRDIKFETVSFPEISKKEIYDRYNFCEKIFNSLLRDLVIELNSIHKIDYSQRSWDIIIGKWLREFIQISYKNYLQIDYALKNYNINKIYSIDYKNYDLAVDDTLSQGLARKDSEWLFSLCSKLLDYLNYKKEIVSNLPKKSFFVLPKKEINNRHVKNKGKKLFFKIISLMKYFVNINNYAVINKTYLPFINEKMLELKFFQIPLMWPEIEVKYKDRNQNLRSNIKFSMKNVIDPFENFLRINLPNLLPTFVLENFQNIKKISNGNLYPKKPKFIFTSNSYAYDEVFKVYAANQIKNKIPYFIGQHGNNYFTNIHNNYLSELNCPDKFISWGVEKGPKVINSFNFKTINHSKRSFNKNGKLVMLLNTVGRANHDLYTSDFDQQKWIKTSIKIIQSLRPDIKKNTILRLRSDYFNEYFGIKYVDFFKNLGVTVESGEKDVNKLFSQSRLSLFDYDSTGILENYIYNIPTLFIVSRDYLNRLTSEAERKYQMLLDNSLMFVDEKKLIEHINKHWSNITEWWMSEKNQKVINEFNKNFNVKADNHSLTKLKSLLSKNY